MLKKENKNMKKLAKVVLIGLLAVSSINAKEIFNLQDQYFEKAHKGDYGAALYDLKEVTVSTVNIIQSKSSGRYFTREGESGSISIKLKQSVTNFNVSVKANYGSITKGRNAILTLKSDTGKEYTLSFYDDKIIMNNKEIIIKGYDDEILNTNIEKNGDTITCSINGKIVLAQDIKDFSTLKSIEKSISYYSTSFKLYDSLYGISILGE